MVRKVDPPSETRSGALLMSAPAISAYGLDSTCPWLPTLLFALRSPLTPPIADVGRQATKDQLAGQ
jgi:hypothetical protein